jgi:predicted nucleotidyltransferase
MKTLQYNSKQDLLHAFSENRDRIKSFGVNSLGIFGSFSKDTVNDTSDVDLLVEFIPEKRALIILWSCLFSWKVYWVEK